MNVSVVFDVVDSSRISIMAGDRATTGPQAKEDVATDEDCGQVRRPS